jgi:hypothetical protein
LALSAKVIKISTTPYTDEEVNQLPPDDYSRVRNLREEKIVGEEVIAELIAESQDELRRSILNIAEQAQPVPIIVLTDAFPDSFLVGKQYYERDPNAIFESIQFRLNDDHPSRVQVNQQVREKRRPQPRTEPERDQTEINPLGSTDEMVEMMNKKIAESMGMDSFQEFIQHMKVSVAKAYESTDNEKEAILKASEELQKRWYEYGGKGSYVELWNPKKHLEKTTILFRVIGKNVDTNVQHLRYYSRFHGITGFCNIVNALSGSPSISFRYGKD